VLGIKKKYFIGIAGHHLTQPDLSYYSNNDNGLLYRKYSLHAGAEFVLRQGDYRTDRGTVYLQPGIVARMQQDAQEVNVGLNLDVQPFVAGVWYRHNIGNPDGIAALVGLRYGRFRVGYSYDFSLSKLSDGSGGAHEVSLALMFACNKRRRRPGALECPEF
jgi:type IX secretion system PorP/SprF family membrane protein